MSNSLLTEHRRGHKFPVLIRTFYVDVSLLLVLNLNVEAKKLQPTSLKANILI